MKNSLKETEKTDKIWKELINPRKPRKNNQTGKANSSRIEDWNRGDKENTNWGNSVILDMENLCKQMRTTVVSITNRMQEIEERILGVDDTIEEIDSLVKEYIKSNKFLTQNIQEIWDTIKRSNLRILKIKDVEELQLKGSKKHIQQNHRRKKFPT